MNYKGKNLNKRYLEVIEDYAKAFLLKQDFIDSDEEFDVKDMLDVEYGYLYCGDMFFDLNDVMFDINNDIEKGKIIEWYDYTLSQSMDGYSFVSYKSYLLGARNKQRGWLKERSRDIDMFFRRIWTGIKHAKIFNWKRHKEMRTRIEQLIKESGVS